LKSRGHRLGCAADSIQKQQNADERACKTQSREEMNVSIVLDIDWKASWVAEQCEPQPHAGQGNTDHRESDNAPVVLRRRCHGLRSGSGYSVRLQSGVSHAPKDGERGIQNCHHRRTAIRFSKQLETANFE
jgi:hypothetical protein